jgi:signal transduction histidine kinase/DNA-binding response OmpR family regulator
MVLPSRVSSPTGPIPLTPGVPDDKSLRFMLALQRSRIWVYLAVLAVAFLGQLTGVFDIRARTGLALVASGILSAVVFHEMVRRRIHLRLPVDLNWVWMLLDTGLICWGVSLTGGVHGPWFVWFLSNTSAAALVNGRRAAIIIAGVNTAAYLATLYLLGQIGGLDVAFFRALTQKVLLYTASAFFLRGVARLQLSQRQLQELRADEQLKVEELIRLTQDLDQGTRALAEANIQIREADQVKSQFLANMSHELRTPLNSIIGFSEILMERLAQQVEPRYLKFLANINSSGQHLLGIINDILDLSKVEAGQMELRPEFRVPMVVEGILNVMHGMAGPRNITFEVQASPDLPTLTADPAKFKQILYNLLSNAVKFSPDGSLVTIDARCDPARHSPIGLDSITVSVTDRGIGIAPSDQEVIFHEFRQADQGSSRNFGGTGLGLALVKKFVELQGGVVGLESALGHGSTFSFTLPVLAAARDEAVAPTASPTELQLSASHRILVVEDDIVAYQTLSRCLNAAGYFPIRARLGEEALQMARLLKPTAITLDLSLPDLSGWEVLKEIKRDPTTSGIPVVIISMMDNRELGLTLGAEDYFVKPVDRERLISRLREIAPAPNGSVGGRLLLIDDDPAIHDLLDAELGPLGYEVSHAFSGKSGMEAALAHTPDAIVLDLMMPDVTGFEVAEMLQARAETAHVPIVVLTAKDLSGGERQQLRGKIAALVQKGHATPLRLVAAIRDLESRHAKEVARGH